MSKGVHANGLWKDLHDKDCKANKKSIKDVTEDISGDTFGFAVHA